MTQTQRDAISAPIATGLLIFQTDNSPGFYFYNGSSWTLLGGTSGAITGSGTNGYLTFWNGTNSVTGESNLFWDATNNRLGINTSSPNAPLQVNGRVYQTGLGNSNFFGDQAGLNDDGTYNLNSAFGYHSLTSNTSGSENSAFGYGSLLYNDGSFNSAFGSGSLYNNTAGNYNSAFGNSSLSYLMVGFYNTAVGYNAGRYYGGSSQFQTCPNNSVYLGSNTRALNNGDTNEIVIGYDAMGVGSNSVVLGNSSITKTVLRGSVGLGTESPNSSSIFDMTSTSKGILIPRMTQTQRNAISSPATGLLIYQTDNTPGFYYYTGSAWSSIGGSGTVTGSGTNGYVTFWNGTNSVTGESNLFWDATNNRLGINTSSPNAPLQVNGRVYQDNLNFSTFFGYNAGQNQDGSGDRNIAMGYNALQNLTSGDHNTALGTDAGQNVTTGTYSVFLGSGSQPGANNNTNEIVIGYGTTGLGSNTVVLGNSSITNTYLRGTVAIGNTNPSTNLDVNGNGRFRLVSAGTFAYNLNMTSDGTLTTSTSDIKMKTNIENLNSSLEKISKLRGVSFNWKNEPDGKKHLGFIAQEVEEVIPELVFTNPVDGYKGINYSEITAVLTESIKEQQSQINELKAENLELKNRLNEIERKVEGKNILAKSDGFSTYGLFWIFLSVCAVGTTLFGVKKIIKSK